MEFDELPELININTRRINTMRRIVLCTYCLEAERSHGSRIAAIDYLDDEENTCDYCDTEYDLMECMEDC
jgi:hypothetical protein